METRITELVGIRHPILLGGMAGVGNANLAAAVSEAGGLGTLAAATLSGARLGNEIERLRLLTDRPFAVNIPLMVPQAAELVSVVIRSAVPAVVTAAGDPLKYTSRFKEAGIPVIHVVPSSELARKAEEAGVDAVIAEGFESGGFASPYEIGTMALVPQVVDAVGVPVIAAGGIADARGYAACLILGAEGASVGTAFLLTRECTAVGNAWRGLMQRANDTSTRIFARGVAPLRALINRYTDDLEKRICEGMTRKEIINEMQNADWSGEEDGLFPCGQAVGLLKEVRTVREVMEEFVSGAEDIFRKIGGSR
jgi:enoyl-[acyl-carrier protein] reductase II